MAKRYQSIKEAQDDANFLVDVDAIVMANSEQIVKRY
jgi:hypothetical protein